MAKRTFACDNCGSTASSAHPAARFCTKQCRYAWKTRQRDPRSAVTYGTCACGTPFAGRYGEQWCRHHRGVLAMPMHGPTLKDWPEFKPIAAPFAAHVECESCGLTFVTLNTQQRFCSELCLRIHGGYVARTSSIEVGDCRRCGRAYVRRGHPGSSGCCSPTCTTRLRRSIQRRKRRAVVSEPYTLREIAERDGWRCHLCGKRVPDREYAARDADPTIDHLIPVSRDGEDVRTNVALAHNRCNWERGNQGLAQLILVA